MNKSEERREKKETPADVANSVTAAGGTNVFQEPNFRIVWGWNRLVKEHGSWETHKPTGFHSTGIVDASGKEVFVAEPPSMTSVIETREVPKYWPGNCWHLEKWCPPSDYGSPEQWGKMGEDVVGAYTIDTAGPYPSRGEYELVMPLTDDGTPQGKVMELSASVVELIIHLINKSRDLRFAQRKAAILQREARKQREEFNFYYDYLRDRKHAFNGLTFVTNAKEVLQ